MCIFYWCKWREYSSTNEIWHWVSGSSVWFFLCYSNGNLVKCVIYRLDSKSKSWVSEWVIQTVRQSVTVRPAGRQAVLGGRQAGRSWVCIALASSDNQMRVVLSSVLRSCAEALWQPSPSCPISFLPFILLHLVPFPLLVSFLQLGKWSLSVLFNTIFLFSL